MQIKALIDMLGPVVLCVGLALLAHCSTVRAEVEHTHEGRYKDDLETCPAP